MDAHCPVKPHLEVSQEPMPYSEGKGGSGPEPWADHRQHLRLWSVRGQVSPSMAATKAWGLARFTVKL